MAQIATNVVASKPKAGGCVYSAPLGTALPTDASASLNEAFVSLGYLDASGVSEKIDDASQDIAAFGGDIVMTVTTSHKVSQTFTPIERNEAALKETFGHSNVTKSGENINVTVNAKEAEPRSYVFEYVLSDGRIERDVVPIGKVTDVGDATYADNSPIANSITITDFPDEAGNKEYKYIAKVS